MVSRTDVALAAGRILAAGIAVLLFAAFQLWSLRDAADDRAALRVLLSEEHADEYLRAKLDLIGRRADDARSPLVYLLALGGFITAAQDLFAFLNLQSYTKQADDALSKLEKVRENAEKAEQELRREVESIRRKLPAFAQLNHVIENAVSELQSFFNEPDNLSDIYRNLSPLQQQKVVYLEKGVAGLEAMKRQRIDRAWP